MPSLAEIQQAFAGALRDPDLSAPDALGNGSAGRRFNVHRNNMVVSLVDVLKSTFPAVHRLVGEEYFTAAARAYVDAHPPRSPVLLLYGRRFGDFVEKLPSAAGVPYLGDVARLEWARLNALHAPDAKPAAIEAMAGLPVDTVGGATLVLHPSLSLIDSRWPVVSLWAASTGDARDADVDMQRPEHAAVIRPALKVGVQALSPASAAFIRALERRETLAAAAQRAAAVNDSFDLAAALRLVFDIGAVVAVHSPRQKEEQS